MISKIYLPHFADLNKPCLACRYYCRNTTVYDAMNLFERLKNEGEKIEYEYGQKYCLKQKQFVYFNWNCPYFSNW
ncbi:MAG: hypothetical protein IT280_00405 [Ignavibacteria bacterium]|nr:hypothetical protein [Ignavibacteria bacterium]